MLDTVTMVLGRSNRPPVVVLLMAILIVQSGCAGPAWEHGQTIDDPDITRQLVTTLEHHSPRQLQARLRVIVSDGRHETAISALVFADQSVGLRFVALDDLGMSVFDVIRLLDKSNTIIKRLPGVAPWLVNAAARDASILFVERPSDTAYAVELEGPKLGLLDEPSGSMWVFDEGGNQWLGFRMRNGGRCAYETSFDYPAARPHSGWPPLMKITIQDHDHRLNVTITILSVEATDLAKNILEQGLQ